MRRFRSESARDARISGRLIISPCSLIAHANTEGRPAALTRLHKRGGPCFGSVFRKARKRGHEPSCFAASRNFTLDKRSGRYLELERLRPRRKKRRNPRPAGMFVRSVRGFRLSLSHSLRVRSRVSPVSEIRDTMNGTSRGRAAAAFREWIAAIAVSSRDANAIIAAASGLTRIQFGAGRCARLVLIKCKFHAVGTRNFVPRCPRRRATLSLRISRRAPRT
jgi:hypothetical protein